CVRVRGVIIMFFDYW
nr:immunoglobulin heavy chain junction region [Macaca mulatta]